MMRQLKNLAVISFCKLPRLLIDKKWMRKIFKLIFFEKSIVILESLNLKENGVGVFTLHVKVQH